MPSANVFTNSSRLGPPSSRLTSEQAQQKPDRTLPADCCKEFHLEEYNALRLEIMQHAAANTSVEREALIGSVAIYSWGLSQSVPPMYVALIFFLPLALTYMSWMRARTHGAQIFTLGEYIHSLEKYFNEPIRGQVPLERPQAWWRRVLFWHGAEKKGTYPTREEPVYGSQVFRKKSRPERSDRLGVSTDVRWKWYLFANGAVFIIFFLISYRGFSLR